jgi:bifunctional DNase/RNase
MTPGAQYAGVSETGTGRSPLRQGEYQTEHPTCGKDLPMIEATVESIRVSLVTQNRVVILKETHGNRHLPIWIGPYEAEAIALELQGVTPTRPLPYDLMRAMLEELGASIDHIVIGDLNDQVFYATVVLTVADRTIQLDSRPSDAIALAVRTDARILIDESVMDNAAVSLDDEGDPITDLFDTQKTSSAPEQPQAGIREGMTGGPGADELGVFRDFINSLDLDDFDKGNPPKG